MNEAVGYAATRSVTSFISVVDRGTGEVAAQTGNAQSQVASESIMKLLLASYYLVLYGGWASGDSIGDEDSRRHLLGLLATYWGLGSDLLTDLFAAEADAGTRHTLARYQRAASSAPGQSPAITRAFSAPIGRPQLPGGASAMLSQ